MSLARDVTTVGSATLVSRLLAFVRDAGIAALLGASVVADAFFVALLMPNFARRLLADGALNAALVPAWLQIKEREGEAAAARFTLQVGGAMVIGLVVLVVAGVTLAPQLAASIAPGFEPGDPRLTLAAEYLRAALPYLWIAGLVAVLAGALNAEGDVAAVNAGIIIFNVAMLTVLLMIGVFAPPLASTAGALLAQAFVLAGLAQLAVVGWAAWPLLRKAGGAPARPAVEVLRFFVLAGPGLIAASAPQLALIAGTMIASGAPNAVSWLTYANRLYELPLGVLSAAIASVMVPRIAAGLRSGRPSAGGYEQSRAFEIAVGLALPAATGLAILAVPIVAVLFERGVFGPEDTVAVAAALAAICAGLPAHALEKVLGAVAFARDDTRTPMITGLAGLAAAVTAALMLFPIYGHVGVAAGIAVGAWAGVVVLGFSLGRRGLLRIDHDARRRLPRMILATVAMAVAILVLQTLIGEPRLTIARIGALALEIGAGLVSYLAMLQVLGVARIADLIAAVRKSV